MPDLTTTLHTDMLRDSRRRHSLPRRLYRGLRSALTNNGHVYGVEWGDPETVEPLRHVKDHWLLPYVNRQHTALEIGPGGGRWTRYLRGFGRLYVVDYYPEVLAEARRNIPGEHITWIANGGTDFPGVPERSIDFLWSFGCFVHLEVPLIQAYLDAMRPILAPGAQVVLHYSDKRKPIAAGNRGFVPTTPELIRALVEEAGYRVLAEDPYTMWHSGLIRFTH